MDTETVRSKFQEVAKIRLEDVLAEHCALICQKLGISPEALANEWEAFAINRNYEDVTLQRLDKLSDNLGKKLKQGTKKGVKVRSALYQQSPADVPTQHNFASMKKRMAGQGRRVTKSQFDSPVMGKRFKGGSMTSTASPPLTATASPMCTLTSYADRKNMGKVECTLHGDLEVGERTGEEEVDLQLLGGEEYNATKPYLYMYSTLEERAAELDRMIEDKKKLYEKQCNIEEWSPLGGQSQEPVTVCGRVCCDAVEGKLNASSIVLEGSTVDNGRRVKLDVKNGGLKEYALFPGQIVAVEGMCTSGHTIIASQIHSDVSAPRLEDRPKRDQPLSCFVSSGPYSTSSDLGFEPLEDLLAAIREDKPDVAILLGPFVDINHPSIASAKPVIKVPSEDGKEVEEVVLTMQELYEMITSRITAGIEGLKTRVVIVPSLSDAFHHVVYPQPPLSWPGDPCPAVSLLPNPCTFRINDVVFAVSTSDVMFDLSKEALCVMDKSKPRVDRLSRIAQMVLSQRSFYPLFPPAITAKVDTMQHKRFSLSTTPDVLVTPSRLSHFAKSVQDTVCLNPGMLTRGVTGGVYAKLQLNPATTKEEEQQEFSVKNVKVEIVRV